MTPCTCTYIHNVNLKFLLVTRFSRTHTHYYQSTTTTRFIIYNVNFTSLPFLSSTIGRTNISTVNPRLFPAFLSSGKLKGCQSLD
ncbi:hypothetical protein P8452_36717 [Trifolium repens]|nr:hypothetical protein P8452_36717 [Trifolium repens]